MGKWKGPQAILIAGFLLLITGVPIAQGVIELGRGVFPQALTLFGRWPSVANLRSFEREMERVSWAANRIRPLMQYVRFALFRDAGEKVILGREGWWFYRPGVQYLIEPAAVESKKPTGRVAAVSAIVRFRDQVSERGIRLLVVPVPGKASIYPDKLTQRAEAADPRVWANTAGVIADLRESGIEVVDLFAAFAQARAEEDSDHGSLFLKRDTHWTNLGVRLAAKRVSGRILELGWARKGTAEYETRTVRVKRRGDLLRMLQTPRIEQRFEPEEVDCEQVIDPRSGNPYQDSDAAGILVLGDSFLRVYEQDEPGAGGFVAHLARQMRQPMTSIVNDGGASTLVRQALARRPERLEDKTLVVWEFVERDIRFGTEGWQDVPLPR